MTQHDTMSAKTGLPAGALTLRQTADALGTSTTTLRKMIRQGRLPEAEKVRTIEGRVWSIRVESIRSIAERSGFVLSVTDSIDLRDPEVADAEAEDTPLENSDTDTDTPGAFATEPEVRTAPVRHLEPVPSETFETEADTELESAALSEAMAPVQTPTPVEPVVEPATTAIESAGPTAEVETVEASGAPSLADVLDTALLEKLLGAKDAETQALVVAERQRTEYESLAARQLEVERRYEVAEVQRKQLAERLHDEALARAIADARVTELRDQLQREITYAEAERYERRQALARETLALSEAAETRASLGWRARRRLSKKTEG